MLNIKSFLNAQYKIKPLNIRIVPYTYYALLFTFHCYSLFRANTDDSTDCAVGAHACANGCCCDSV